MRELGVGGGCEEGLEVGLGFFCWWGFLFSSLDLDSGFSFPYPYIFVSFQSDKLISLVLGSFMWILSWLSVLLV